MLSPITCIVVIGMNTRRVASRTAKEETVNMGDQDNQVPPLQKVAIGDEVPVGEPVAFKRGYIEIVL